MKNFNLTTDGQTDIRKAASLQLKRYIHLFPNGDPHHLPFIILGFVLFPSFSFRLPQCLLSKSSLFSIFICFNRKADPCDPCCLKGLWGYGVFNDLLTITK